MGSHSTFHTLIFAAPSWGFRFHVTSCSTHAGSAQNGTSMCARSSPISNATEKEHSNFFVKSSESTLRKMESTEVKSVIISRKDGLTKLHIIVLRIAKRPVSCISD